MRYLGSFAIAALLSTALFLFMYQLIDTGAKKLKETDAAAIELFQVAKEQQQQFKSRKRPEPPVPLKTPPPPPEITIAKAAVNTPLVEIHMPKIRLSGINTGGLPVANFNTNNIVQDSSAIPLLLTQPVYPREALMDGTEGYVKLQFTVTPAGTVKDIKVIEAKPKRIFNRAAKKALLKSKFKPDVVDGIAISSKKIYTYEFTMGN